MNKRELKKLRKEGVNICGKCFRTDKETRFYKSETRECAECRRAYMNNYREVRNRLSYPPVPVQKIKPEKLPGPKEYTEELELCERALLTLKKSGRLVGQKTGVRRGADPRCATVGDIIAAIHSESRRSITDYEEEE